MKKVIIMFFLASTLLFSKEYYIGDKISLKINKNLDEKELEEAFKNFKIIKKEKDKLGNIIIMFTSFKVGENILKLGDREIILPIKSSISKNENKIYKRLADKKNEYRYKYSTLKNISFLTTGILFILLGMFFWHEDRRKNDYLNFLNSMKKINSDNWREDISYYLRKYIDRCFNGNFLGGEYKENNIINDEDIKFIRELDKLKFTPNTLDKYEDIKNRAIKLAEKIKGGVKDVHI